MKNTPSPDENISVRLVQQLDEAKEQIRILSYKGHLAEMLNDASIDRIMALDTDLRIIAWNKQSELVTGIHRDSVLGEHYFDIFPEAARHQPTRKAIEQVLQGRTVFLPSDRTGLDGGYYENHYLPLKDSQDKVAGVMNIKHDVAHRIKAENELKALNKALARKNRELKQRNEELLSFTQVTSHDLKEPLRKIYTFIEMITSREAGSLTDKGRNYFKRIQSAVQRMGMLTDDILTFAEINTENAPATDVRLDHVVMFAERMLEEEIKITQASVTYDEMPEVRGYRQLLTQLFYHVMANAIKFRQKDLPPRISISWEETGAEKINHPDALPDVSYIKVSIRDNGIGFHSTYREKIFQMFQRLNKEGYPGTGIGLALCKKIAVMHQGFMTADSTEGEGSVFHLYLPA